MKDKPKYLVMDVDGTLTDGKIYMGNDGEEVKAFNIKDGAGISLILSELGIKPIIITARKSKILENRCNELKITEVYQGCFDKLGKLKEIITDLSSVAYVGDDLPDIPCMEVIKKAGGLVLAPFDAIPEVKAMADYVSGYRAGDGAIRDCINYLSQQKQDNVEERVRSVIDWILNYSYEEQFMPAGCSYSIQKYMTKEEKDCVLESHRNHIDVQYMIEGHEEFDIFLAGCLTGTGEYSVCKDVEQWQSGIIVSRTILVPGSIVVVYNNQPHKGAIISRQPENVKKLVCKIEV